MTPNVLLFRTLGISVVLPHFRWQEWLRTLGVDLAAGLCELILVLINRKIVSLALAEAHWLTQPIARKLVKQHKFWCYFSIALQTIFVCCFPSGLSIFFLLVVIAVTVLWVANVKVEDRSYSCCSFLIFWLTLFSILAGYILYIQWFQNQNISQKLIKFLGVPLLVKRGSVEDLLQFILLMAILIVSTIYSQTYQAYMRKKRIERLKLREIQLREYGRALDQEGKGQGDSFIKVAQEVQKERMLKNEIQLAKIAGNYTKELRQHYEERETMLEGNISQLLTALRQRKKDVMQQQVNRAPRVKKKKAMTACSYVCLVVCNFFRSFQFFIMLTRCLLILWFMLYTSVPSLPLLVFLLHSVLYQNQHNFVLVLSLCYFPYLLVLILYHHVIQSVIQFGFEKIPTQTHDIQYQRNFDLRAYRIHELEMGFQMLTLLVVAVSIKIRAFNFTAPAPPSKSNYCIQLFLLLAKYFKSLMVIFLYFVAISHTDLYHFILLIFFCFYVVSSKCMDRSFSLFQILVALYPVANYCLIVFRFFYQFQNSKIKDWIAMLGLSLDFDQQAVYFMYLPNTMIWVLLTVTYIQTKCYIVLQNTQLVNKLTRSFYDSNPSLTRCAYISLRFLELHFVWLSFILIFIALILDHKSLIEYVLWIIICCLLVAQLAPNYKKAKRSKDPCGWSVLLVVTCFYVIALSAFQLVYLDYPSFEWLKAQIPLILLESADFIGFFKISLSQTVRLHILKLLIIVVATLTRAALLVKHKPPPQRPSFNIYHATDSQINPRINYSLFQPQLDEFPEQIFNDENLSLKDYCAEQIDSSYFILKCKRIWFIIDLVSGSFFELLAFTVFILAIMFRFAFIFALLLLILAIYYGQLHSALYNRNVKLIQAHQGDLLFSNFDKRMEDRSNTLIRIDYRSRYWTAILLIIFLLILAIYPSQFLYQMLDLKIYQNFSGALKDTIWFSFLIGDTYLKPTASDFLSYSWGYFLILVMAVLERKAQSWTYNRFEVDEGAKSTITRMTRQQAIRKEKNSKISSNLRKSTTYRGVMKRTGSFSSDLTLIQEESRRNTRGREKSMQIEEQARHKIEHKYKIGLARGIKATYENIMLYLTLVACIVKANFFSLIYIVCLFFLQICTSNNSRKMLSLTQLVACLFVLQYLVMLSNLNSLVSPFPLPPFQVNSFFQWYQYIGGSKLFLKSFAQYFQLGTQQIQLYYLWFEVVLLLLLGAYFHLFCYKYFQIPQRLLFSDLRKQQVKSVEDIAEINKFLHSLGLTSLSRSITRNYLDGPKRSLGRSASSLFELDLVKIKSQMAMRDFYRVLRKVVYVFTNIFTLCLILTLAVQDSSIISSVYIIFAIYYIYKSRSFYEKKGPGRWWFPCLLRYFLYPYIQIDLLAQILFQMPMRAFFSWEASAFNPEIFKLVGIFELWHYDSDMKLEWDFARIGTLILKGLIYAVIVMQLNIFDSDEYKIFIYKDLKKNKHQNEIRGLAMSYSYNNSRLKAVCLQTASKKNMVENLSILRHKLNELWSDKSNEFSRLATAMEGTLFRKHVKLMGASEKAEFAEGEAELNDEEQVYQAAYREAPTSVKLYIWINNNLTNPLMVQGGEILKRSKEAIYLGKDRVRSDIEYYMIDHYIVKKKFQRDLLVHEDMQDQQVDSIEKLLAQEGPRANFINPALTRKGQGPVLRKEVLKKPVMPHTIYNSELRCRKMTNRYLMRIGSSIIAHTDAVAYLMMFINQMINGNLLSLVLPVSILGFALMEQPRPSNAYWKFVLIYTELVIVFKFALNISTVATLAHQNNQGVIITLLTKNGLGSLYKDILVDTITVFILLIHQFVLISLGIWEKREHEQESVTQAIDRLLHPHRQAKAISIVESNYGNMLDDMVDSRKRAFSEKKVKIQEARDPFEELALLDEAQFQDKRTVRFFSDGNLQILREVSREKLDIMHQELQHIRESRLSCCKRCKRKTVSLMFSCSYFERLFPDIRQEKPGVDLIALMNLPLFLAVIFVILFYSQISKSNLSLAQSISQNNFSTGMVIFVLVQIAQLVLERFLYLKQRQLTLSSKGIKSEVKPKGSIKTNRISSHLLRQGSSLGVKSHSGLDEGERLMENPAFKHLDDQVTRIGREYAQCLRWLLHLLMVLTIHFVLFQYLTWCNLETFETQKYFNKEASFWCNPFQQNWALIVLYIIYLTYLVLSALQIREGLPELRSINAITRQDTLLNKWIYQAYLAIPFLWELRTITDWTFTKTALDLFQWFKFQDIFSTLYITKVTTQSYRAHPLGQKRQFIYKILQGACTLLGLLLLIFLPMVFFSGLNPISEVNNVTGAEVQFNLKLNDTTSYSLFDIKNTASLQSITSSSISNSTVYSELFDKNRIYFIDYQPEQIQIPELNKVASSNWEITPLAVQEVSEYLRTYNQTKPSKPEIEIEMRAQFNRPLPAGGQQITSRSSLIVKQTDYVLVNQLQNIFERSECTNRTFDLDNFYNPYLHLTSNSDPQIFQASQVSRKQTISLFFHCQVSAFNASGQIIYETQRYWSAYTRLNQTTLRSNSSSVGQSQLSTIPNSPGIVFLTVSDKVASSFISFSVLTFYISVVLVVGQFLRNFCKGGAQTVVLKEMPFPDDLLLLCEAIVVSRIQNNLERQEGTEVREEELYYVLIELLRSPETVRAITKSSLRKQN